jgi:hypothetical protein
LKAGEPVVVEQRSLQNLWDRKTPLISEEPGWDPNRDKDHIPLNSSIKTVLDPLAYLVGPVRVVYGGDPARSSAIDLTNHIDRDGRIVRSVTGEIETEYGRGLFRIDAPKAQAVAGFLKDAGAQHLTDVDITCGNSYASIAVVALDDKPIRESERLLIQAGTLCRPTGWTVVPTRARIDGKQSDCFRVLSVGEPPLQVENVEATLTIANPRLSKGTLLDINGMATSTPVDVKQLQGKVTVRLPTHTIYLVLR